MWTAAIAFVLVCGYHYIDNHQPSKIELKKANGWVAYFQVALKGCQFVVYGTTFSLIIEILIYLSMYIINIPSYMGLNYSPFSYAYDFNKFQFAQVSSFFWLSSIFTVLFSISQSSEAKRNNNLEYKLKEIKNLYKNKPLST